MNITEHNVNGLVYLAADGFEAAGGVAHGFSTRLGGVSEGKFSSLNLSMNRGDDPDKVRENYRRFCAAIGADMTHVVCSSQVHGDVVRTITTADLGIGLDQPEPWQADGLVTDIPGVVLTVFNADCLPILLYDPVRRVVGAVHAGWRGTALGIVNRAVDRMVDCYGCDRLDILAAIGPGISQCCFETHEDVPNAMTEAMGASALHGIQVLPTGKFRVDLKKLNVRRLESAGLDPDHIAVSADCTACLPDKYWSHRVTKGERGSQAAMIAIV
ncbi:peptidoglycan editing factor PgeF [Pseudoflavonifractor phocaeensis]|uniref:peptidoglycan editing factor PgeF n=1 Tax=Pseudoflavonifractor phocaeensis TaxID=1870988 RepID=UPI001959BD51|nr:peptidoglycan editing factor PgeF [Pseudoflavonifractor phocaeensis]MBM6927319.1 peptidoglycan editing factor PgeF [Pseudoflavonifractor phocaeensis]